MKFFISRLCELHMLHNVAHMRNSYLRMRNSFVNMRNSFISGKSCLHEYFEGEMKFILFFQAKMKSTLKWVSFDLMKSFKHLLRPHKWPKWNFHFAPEMKLHVKGYLNLSTKVANIYT